ncbi:unnamed protein product [Larinioides sclopetarius]|uniref:Single domain-containing protein n=1 Tax=Larinioides sclopetarius TaxID=280406 RepID=A0AAV2BKS0_9ARAC
MPSFKMGTLTATATLLLILIAFSDAYRTSSFVYQRDIDTSSGFCKIDGKDEIPVGGEDFDDKACERTFCGEGYYERQGCSVEEDVMDLQCKLVRKSGNYPTCCELVYVCN